MKTRYQAGASFSRIIDADITFAPSMQETTRSVATLENLILSRVEAASFRIIGIDGTDGSGKSTLARQLASRFKTTVVELDSLLRTTNGGYVDFVDYAALAGEISSCKDRSVLLIVEGVCLLAALERVATEPSLLIYVKRISRFGGWYDDYYCEPRESPTAANEECEQMFAATDDEVSEEENTLLFEIARYHQSYKPTEKADVFFERIVDE